MPGFSRILSSSCLKCNLSLLVFGVLQNVLGFSCNVLGGGGGGGRSGVNLFLIYHTVLLLLPSYAVYCGLFTQSHLAKGDRVVSQKR